MFANMYLPVCSDCIQQKLTIFPNVLFQMWITLPNNMLHPLLTKGLFHLSNSVHKHERLLKGLYNGAMSFNVLHFCDMKATCVM